MLATVGNTVETLEPESQQDNGTYGVATAEACSFVRRIIVESSHIG